MAGYTEDDVRRCEEEARKRIAKAHENVAAWSEKYGGLSGGFRIVHEDASGAREVSRGVIGDPVLARKIEQGPPASPLNAPAVNLGWPKAAKPAALAKPRWWQRLFSLFR